MLDHIISRLRRFHTCYFPRLRKQFRNLVDQGQHPTVLFIGCSDSRGVSRPATCICAAGIT